MFLRFFSSQNIKIMFLNFLANSKHVFKSLQNRLFVSEDDDNATYLFDMEANPGERTDGDCAVFERCNNLLGHADYGSVHANLRSRFFDYLDTMVPSSVNFKYDGPLANPEYFNGSLGVPWRDENDVPYVTDDLTPYLTDSLRSSVHTINSPARNQQDVLAIDFDGHNIYNQVIPRSLCP